MISFEHISFGQIYALAEAIANSTSRESSVIGHRYSENAKFFSETLEFLEKLHIVKIRGDIVHLQPEYKAIVSNFDGTYAYRDRIKQLIVRGFLLEKNPYSSYLQEFLGKFEFINGRYQYSPEISERLLFSGLRNLLLELEFIWVERDNIRYTIDDGHAALIPRLLSIHVVAPHELLSIQSRQSDIGRAAELEVMEYERNRLAEFPSLVHGIEHVALTNVTAGYDIKSFLHEEGGANQEGSSIIFIEVKAVSSLDYGFYWSRNEIEASKRFRESYFLYLLPAMGEGSFDLKLMKIIRNPFAAVFNDESLWYRTCELYKFAQRLA
jgi:hypothetical protein